MLNLNGPEAHCKLKLPPKPKQGYRNMWAGANVDRAVRPRGELLLLIEQQRHQLQRQKRELETKQQEVDRQKQELEAKQQEVDRLVAEVEVLKKRKREQDQGSDNITVASSQ